MFSFAAGEFKSIKSKGPLDMSIYAWGEKFDELITHDKPDTIFVYIEESMKYYESFFRTKYPFEKIDLVFLPDYNGGAMENPGMITFSDDFITKNPTTNDITQRGLYLAHELAHMWFGNYVTMKWWDDLWLNEAFADFAAFNALANIHNALPFE